MLPVFFETCKKLDFVDIGIPLKFSFALIISEENGCVLLFHCSTSEVVCGRGDGLLMLVLFAPLATTAAGTSTTPGK